MPHEQQGAIGCPPPAMCLYTTSWTNTQHLAIQNGLALSLHECV